MRDLTHVPLRMERDGTSVVLYNPELTGNYLTAPVARFVTGGAAVCSTTR